LTPKFIRTTIPEKETLGEKLAKKRSALGYDIKETERLTRIRAKYIEYLEAGQYDKLPPDVYVRGFLKNYSTFLKLDESKVLRLYLKEKGLAENVRKVTSPKTPVKTKSKPSRVILTPQRIIIGSVIIGAMLLVGWFISELMVLAAPPTLTINTPNDNLKTTEQSLIVEGKTDAGNDVSINSVPIGVDPDGGFKEKVSLQQGVNLIKISAKNKLGKSIQTDRTVLAELSSVSAPTTTQTGLKMILDVGPGSNSLYIVVDGKPLSDKNVLMLPGSTQTINAQNIIVISATDGGSARINLNGKDLGTLGSNGQKVSNKAYNRESTQ
jgi:cytoskeletal protein RodZ